MSTERKFTITAEKLKEALSEKFNVDYNDIDLGWNSKEDMVFEITRGLLKEEILLTDTVVYETFNIDKNELELDYMLYSDSYSFIVDELDSNTVIDIYAKEPSDLKDVA